MRPSLPISRSVLSAALVLSLNGPAGASNPVDAAYVVLGEGGQATARVITADQSCPSLTLDGRPQPMRLRVEAATVPNRGGAQPDSKAAAFPLRVCEATLPQGLRRARLGALGLPLPKAAPRRILVIGDTGCRLKASDHVFQACNDSERWPFASLARQAAAWKPDLVIHVGDYHYRESPCPENNTGCAGSPWGYGYDAWRADFFQPAAPLLAAAPWVMVRGNHESCFRAGQGWFRFLDSRPWRTERSCDQPAQDPLADYSAPYAVPLAPDSQLIVFDSSKTAGKAYGPQDPAFGIYREHFRQVAALAGQKHQSFFFNHHPILAFAPVMDETGQLSVKPGNGALQGVMAADFPQRLFPPGVTAAFEGHVHLFQALSFVGDHPATFISGNGSTAMDKALPAQLPPDAHPAPGVDVAEFFNSNEIGYLTLERRGPVWRITEWNRHGQASLVCSLRGQRSHCQAPKRS